MRGRIRFGYHRLAVGANVPETVLWSARGAEVQTLLTVVEDGAGNHPGQSSVAAGWAKVLQRVSRRLPVTAPAGIHVVLAITPVGHTVQHLPRDRRFAGGSRQGPALLPLPNLVVEDFRVSEEKRLVIVLLPGFCVRLRLARLDGTLHVESCEGLLTERILVSKLLG